MVRQLFGNRVLGTLGLQYRCWQDSNSFADINDTGRFPYHVAVNLSYVLPVWAQQVGWHYYMLDKRIRGDAIQNAIDDYLLDPHPIRLDTIDESRPYYIDGTPFLHFVIPGFYPDPEPLSLREFLRLKSRQLLRRYWIRLTTH